MCSVLRVQRFRIGEICRRALRKLDDIDKRFAKITFEHRLFDPRAVRRAQYVGHFQQRMIAVQHRFIFVDVHRGVTGAALPERRDQRAGRDNFRPRRIDEQGRGPHGAKIGGSH